MSDTSLIFLHGFPLNGSSWDSQAKYFSKQYKVHTPDSRGMGNAIEPPGPWMMHHFSDDLKRFMDTQKIDKAVVCGLSMGGYVALHFIAENPDRVQSLILCDTRADADLNEAKDKRYSAIQKLLSQNLSEFARDFSSAALSEATLKEKPEVRNELEKMILQNKPENLAMTLGALASRRDSTPFLEKIQCPTLVLVGSDDKVTSPEINETMSAKIKSAKFQKIEKAGHFPNLEQPDLFNQYVDTFLKS